MHQRYQNDDAYQHLGQLTDQSTGKPTPSLAHANDSAVKAQGADAWQKVLWKRQQYPDNYTDDTFLKELVINADVPRRSFWKVVLGSFIITQQLSIAVVSITLPAYMQQEHSVPLHHCLLAAAVMVATGYLTDCISGRSYLNSVVDAVDRTAIIICGAYIGAPVLRLVAAALGRDSLIACILFLMLGHLYAYDYNFKASTTESFLGASSQGAAITSTVLASTFIPHPLPALFYILLSSTLILVAPYPRQSVRSLHPALHTALTAALASAAHRLLAPLSANLTSVLLMAYIFISLLCPWWLVRIHKFKAQINGPWDEAVPHIPTSISFPCSPRTPSLRNSLRGVPSPCSPGDTSLPCPPAAAADVPGPVAAAQSS